MLAMLRRPAGGVIALAVLATLVLGLVAVLARTGGPGSDSRTPPAEISYAQTWPKAYEATTCADFLDAMTSQQRAAAGADLLVSARVKGDSAGMPSDALIADFTAGLRNACPIAPDLSVSGAADALYARHRDRFRR
jgi:hypothetical protein